MPTFVRTTELDEQGLFEIVRLTSWLYLCPYSSWKTILEAHCCDSYVVLSSFQANVISDKFAHAPCCAYCILSHRPLFTNVFPDSV